MSRLRGSDYYHRRSEELRLAASEPRLLDNRDTLLYFAADLDELADEAAAAEREQSQKRARHDFRARRQPARRFQLAKRF
jgi:hypothetical protein